MPKPATNVPIEVGGGRVFEVDCLWRRQGVVVELDSRAYHNNDRGFYRDRRKHRALTVAGLRVLPVTDVDLNRDPDRVEIDLRSLLTSTG